MRLLLVLLVCIGVSACGPDPGPPPIAERFNGNIQRDPARTERLVTLTHAYWAALAGQRWHQAYRFHTLEFQQAMPFEAWLAKVRGRIHSAQRPTTIRWSKGAHRHQGPELYAVIDWYGSGGRTGRIVWREQRPGEFLVERTEPL